MRCGAIFVGLILSLAIGQATAATVVGKVGRMQGEVSAVVPAGGKIALTVGTPVVPRAVATSPIDRKSIEPPSESSKLEP